MTRSEDVCQVVIIGSGFAGALLARILSRLGYAVVLLERARHPRFAIGESSTPLAALSLERLASRYDLPDLHSLAAHGRWLQRLPTLRRGLKRGFTFYHHAAGRDYTNDGDNLARLLVAASPNDFSADAHWLREDVDAHFVREAAAAGVDYRDQVEVLAVRIDLGGATLRCRREGRDFSLRAGFVVDATGPAGLLARQLGIDSALHRIRTRSALLYGHFDEVPDFAGLARDAGTPMPAGPYPDGLAAVHHCFAGGWMYQLRFDHGTVSAGFLLSPDLAAVMGAAPEAGTPTGAWEWLCRRYPGLGDQLKKAVSRFPLRYQARIQHRMARGAGPGWAALPHTFAFIDPLFSTGIAWSLLGVERLAEAFEGPGRGRGLAPNAALLARYPSLLERELDQIDRLVHGAYLALGDFDLLGSHALLYFAAVSFAEARQRLLPRSDWAWTGFLGVDDPEVASWFAGSARRLARRRRTGASAEDRRRYAAWVASTIAPRNIGGLADPARRNMYDVDLEVLVERAGLLGLTRDEIVAALPRLRAGQATSRSVPR